MNAPVPKNEEARVQALRDYQILDTAAEKVFDDITKLAAEICQTPVSLLSFVDAERLWFKSSIGLNMQEVERGVTFCAHAICGEDLFVVPDALEDERFSRNPVVTGEPNIRFYAGMPLFTPQGHAIGTLCVIDRVPRELSDERKAKMRALAQGAMMLLEVRKSRAAAEAGITGSPA